MVAVRKHIHIEINNLSFLTIIYNSVLAIKANKTYYKSIPFWTGKSRFENLCPKKFKNIQSENNTYKVGQFMKLLCSQGEKEK
jgi:hypothetical protein